MNSIVEIISFHFEDAQWRIIFIYLAIWYNETMCGIKIDHVNKVP